MLITGFIKIWCNVFFRPRTEIFREGLKYKSHLKTFAGICLGALTGLGLSWIVYLISGQPVHEFMGLASVWVEKGTPPPFGSWTLIVPLGVIIGFYDFEIVLFIFARLLGGKGSFQAQTYAQSLFYAPLAIIQQVLAVIPVVGYPLFVLLAAYSLIPTTVSLKAAHDYSMLRALITWLMPIVLNILAIVIIILLIS